MTLSQALFGKIPFAILLKGTPKTTHKSIAKLRSVKRLFHPPPFHPTAPNPTFFSPFCPRITARPLNRGLQWQFNKARRPIVANVARYKPIGLTLSTSPSGVRQIVYERLFLTYSERILDSIRLRLNLIWIFFCFSVRWVKTLLLFYVAVSTCLPFFRSICKMVLLWCFFMLLLTLKYDTILR